MDVVAQLFRHTALGKQRPAWSTGFKNSQNYTKKPCFKKPKKPDVVAHAFNPSTREAEAGRFLSSRPAWSTK
jgi:major histocompatibility complex class I